LATGAGHGTIARGEGEWRISTRAGELAAPILVDAAGAWADEAAAAAGVRPLGLAPKRRTAVIVPAPEGLDVRAWPTVLDAAERFYFKPEAGRLLLSPCNEDDAPPCDVAPEELDVALAVDRFERATTAKVGRVLRRWAGLRTFASDRIPVVGFDPVAKGFFWLAGQGGFGIQTSPALSRLAAALVLGEAVPSDIEVDPSVLSPARFERG
jgi:D-arginine dehydrogenase